MSLTSTIRTGLYGALQVAGQSAAIVAAATNLPTVSGLDLATDECYLFRFRFNNATASAGSIRFFVNGDTTTTNYWSAVTYTIATAGGSRVNVAEITPFDASECVTGWGIVDRDGYGRPRVTCFANEGAPASVSNWLYQMVWTGTANLTNVQLSSTVANSFSPGDYIKFYKIGAPQSAGGSAYTDATFANVSSLLHFDGASGSTTFTDQVSGNVWTPVAATISTAQSVFGGSSALFTGASNSRITCPTNSKFNVGSGDWTLQFRAYPTGTHQAYARIFQSRDGDLYSGIAVYERMGSGGTTFSVVLSSNGSSTDILANLDFVLPTGQWSAVLIQRKGGGVQILVNDMIVAQSPIATLAHYYNAADTVIIGGQSGVSRSFNGHIEEFRFTKGQALFASMPPVTSAFGNS